MTAKKNNGQTRGWWLIVDNGNAIMKTDGRFRKRSEIFYPQLSILRARGINSLIKKIKECRQKIKNGNYFLVFFPGRWPDLITDENLQKGRVKFLSIYNSTIEMIDIAEHTKTRRWRRK
jgi:hypothetical protein